MITAMISSEPVNKEIKAVTMNIVNDRDGFVWKGHDHLPARTSSISFAVGFQPQSLLQLYPPAAVTALAIHSEWGLLAAGTAHGLAVFDYTRSKAVSVKCTLNPNGIYKFLQRLIKLGLRRLQLTPRSWVSRFNIGQCFAFHRPLRIGRHAYLQTEVVQEIAEGVFQEIEKRKVAASDECQQPDEEHGAGEEEGNVSGS